MPPNPVMIFITIILVLAGVFIYQNLPNSPWYPEIAMWVWLAYIIIFVITLFGSWIMGSAL
jgi:hypothetical protein